MHDVEEEEDDERHDGPDPSDRNDEPAEVPCPYCKREIDEEAVQCPFCGSYISAEDAPPQPKPWWWAIALVLLVLLLMGYLWR